MVQVSGAGLTTLIQDNVVISNDPVNPRFKTVNGNVFAAAAFLTGSSTGGIQEAYAAAVAAGGGKIQLPSGTINCAVGVPCLAICANNITVEGYGSSITILAPKNADAISLCNTQSGGLHEIRLRDFGVKPQVGSASGKGIDIIETASAFENSHNSFERITISNMPDQGFHDGNCSWCSFKDLVMQGNSGRGMEVGTAAGGKGGSSNDSSFENVEISTNAFGGMLNWGRINTFKNGHYFANTSAPDLEIRGSDNTWLGGWVEDCVFHPCVLIRRNDPIIYNNKFIGVHYTNTVNAGPVVSVGQAGDAGGSVIGTTFIANVFTSNDAPYPLAGTNNAFADISIDTSATNTKLSWTAYHTVVGTALVDNGSNTVYDCDDSASTCVNKEFTLLLSGSPALTINTGRVIQFLGVTFATLATPANGTIVYCPDCTVANPCAGAGTGALAKRLNGVWVCN